MCAYLTPVAEQVWRTKYRRRDGVGMWEASVEQTWRRVARALASVERDAVYWERCFLQALSDFRFLPGGRILAGAGTGKAVTLFNCFVMGAIEDSLRGVFRALEEGALTMQAGGGVGYDFSSLQPAGRNAATGVVAPGPVAFMQVWQSMCAALTASTERRGAMMATLRCDHPDIEAFIDAKRDPSALTHFNLSVLVSDDFMRAVDEDRIWPLVFRGNGYEQHHRDVAARELWQRITLAAYESAEPGIIFVDRVNQANNLAYCETISATNPCGEIPLPPYGACDLGSVNLPLFVKNPFTAAAYMDTAAIEQVVQMAVRMLDNVYEVSDFPLAQQADIARGSRRLGLGVTGLADALVMLGFRYDTAAARTAAEALTRTIRDAAYLASTELAREKGAFPRYEAARYTERPFVRALPRAVRNSMARHGVRNSHLLAIAPAGSISLLANNVSSGLEPMFDMRFDRRISTSEGVVTVEVEDFAFREFRLRFGEQPLPDAFVTLHEVAPMAQLDMQAALQPYVDNAISKTVTTPTDIEVRQFSELYRYAYRLGLKGCTAFRLNSRLGAVLSASRCNDGIEDTCSLPKAVYAVPHRTAIDSNQGSRAQSL